MAKKNIKTPSKKHQKKNDDTLNEDLKKYIKNKEAQNKGLKKLLDQLTNKNDNT